LFYVLACRLRPRPNQPTIEQVRSDSDDNASVQQQLETTNILSGSVFGMLVLGFVSFVAKQCRMRARKNHNYKQRCLQLEEQLALPSRQVIPTVAAASAVPVPNSAVAAGSSRPILPV
jgi:hypothetical protein